MLSALNHIIYIGYDSVGDELYESDEMLGGLLSAMQSLRQLQKIVRDNELTRSIVDVIYVPIRCAQSPTN